MAAARRSGRPPAWLAPVLWGLVGLSVWNGFFDLYVSRGAREYLQLAAEAELGRRPVPSMPDIMRTNQEAGRRAATTWTAIVVGLGVASYAIGRRRRSD